MPGVVGKSRTAITTTTILDTRLNLLRHLTRPKPLSDILRSRHAFNKTDAKITAKLASPHIQQSLEFYDSFTGSSRYTKPTSLYYALLNLATAVVVCYKPNNWQSYKRHGISDLSAKHSKIDINTKIVDIENLGMLNLVNRTFSECPLQQGPTTLKQIVSGIGFISSELSESLKIKNLHILVKESVILKNNSHHSYVSFTADKTHLNTSTPTIKKHILRAMPSLAATYNMSTSGDTIDCISKQSWTATNRDRAIKFHKSTCFPYINYGCHVYPLRGSSPVYFWVMADRTKLMPAVTCSMLFAFAISSLSRYRINTLQLLLDSPEGILVDTFISEAPTRLIGTFCDMLLKEELCLSRTTF